MRKPGEGSSLLCAAAIPIEWIPPPRSEEVCGKPGSRSPPPLIQAVSVAVTAVFAVIGLRAWRRQLLGRRKIEIAEGTCFATYKIKEAMAYIRNPGAFVGGSTGPRQPDEPEELASLRDSYFVLLERMQKTSGDLAEFEMMQLLCSVYFGPEAGQRFERVKKVPRHTV